MPTFSPCAPELLWKTPNESEIFSFEFSDRPAIVAGETLTGTPTVSISPSTASTPTLGSPSISGTTVRVRISAGTQTAGTQTQYQVTCVVATSGGNTLEGRGLLFLVN